MIGHCWKTSVSKGLLVTGPGRYPRDPPGARPQGTIANGRVFTRLCRVTKRPLAILPWVRVPGGPGGTSRDWSLTDVPYKAV